MIQERSLDEWIADITAVHHACLRRQTGRIAQIVGEIASYNEAGNAIVMEMQQLIGGLCACVESQLAMEEEVLFPMLLRLQEQTVISKCRAGMIRGRVMLAERELARIRGVVLRLRDLAEESLSPGGPCEACHELLHVVRALRADLSEHTRKESEILFPWAVERESELAERAR